MSDFVIYGQPFAVFLFSIIPLLMIGTRFGLGSTTALALYLWHTGLCFVIIYYVSIFGGDQLQYYEYSLIGITWVGKDIVFGFGTAFVTWFTRIFSAGLGFTYISTILVFNFIGSIGLVIFASSIIELSRLSRYPVTWLTWVVIFLPSLGIWTCSISKDAFSFLAVALFIKATMCGRNHNAMVFLSILLMTLVRPHIGLCLLISTLFLHALRIKMSIASIVLLSVLGTVALYLVAPLVATMLNLPDFSADTLAGFIEERGKQADRRDDAAFWYSQSVPVRILMTAFYPTLLSASGILQLIVAAENIILTLMFAALCWMSMARFRLYQEDIHFWAYTMLTWFILGSIMYNSGLAARQKWMFVPVFLFLALKYLGSAHNRNLR